MLLDLMERLMFTIWFRPIGGNPADGRGSVTLTGLAAAQLAWDLLSAGFVMLSARP